MQAERDRLLSESQMLRETPDMRAHVNQALILRHIRHIAQAHIGCTMLLRTCVFSLGGVCRWGRFCAPKTRRYTSAVWSVVQR